jgi:hypothetical protein
MDVMILESIVSRKGSVLYGGYELHLIISWIMISLTASNLWHYHRMWLGDSIRVASPQSQVALVRRVNLRRNDFRQWCPAWILLSVTMGFLPNLNFVNEGLAIFKGPNKVDVSTHLKTETHPVSETLCFIASRILDDGQSPQTQYF